MARTVELYWDFSSPYTYLAQTQAAAMAARTGARLVWRPFFLGGLFKLLEQPLPALTMSPAKREHGVYDLGRWADYWGVPFRFPSRFPMNSLPALRTYLALPEPRRDAFREGVFRAYWADDRDIADEGLLAELAGEGGGEAVARAKSPEIKQALADATDAAFKAGVFGAPTWVVDGRDLYWGQDRIFLVERALEKAGA
ncbi:MAG TPA: 2-hydroxychromene-2-carboxylate isomerase [Polyangiaceae bacterium]|nr:2-hydroxychromene-2-carboxylate isomerase [Polyangiaceae bacterium]